jgi:hypothetical protein
MDTKVSSGITKEKEEDKNKKKQPIKPFSSNDCIKNMVPLTGLEPVRMLLRGILSLYTQVAFRGISQH